MKYAASIFLLLTSLFNYGQSYTSYLTGDANNFAATAMGGVCLMGGATENDEAMTWLLSRAGGGDVLVLRASGSDGYNNYLFSDLGVAVNSVETIVFHNSSAANEPYIHQRIEEAEMIWLAGGDQWDYVSYWRDSPIDSLINKAVSERSCAIGGTSAGMAVLGEIYFSAENGTVTSAEALANPYRTDMTVDNTPFLKIDVLANTITDTHYDSPDRKGRHIAFLARMSTDWGIAARGIACDEYTAVCIDTNGIAYAYGEFPTYDDNVYFLSANCELSDHSPENCSAGQALDWNLGNAAVKVYHIEAEPGGIASFNLNDWQTGVGGNWENWWVSSGNLNEAAGLAPDCSNPPTGIKFLQGEHINFIHNPFTREIQVDGDVQLAYLALSTLDGRVVFEKSLQPGETRVSLPLLPAGLYVLSGFASFTKLSDLSDSTDPSAHSDQSDPSDQSVVRSQLLFIPEK